MRNGMTASHGRFFSPCPHFNAMFRFDPNRSNLPQRSLVYTPVVYQKRWQHPNTTKVTPKQITPKENFHQSWHSADEKRYKTVVLVRQDAKRRQVTGNTEQQEHQNPGSKKNRHVETPCPVTANFLFNPRYTIKMLKHTPSRYGRDEGTRSSPTPPPPPA